MSPITWMLLTAGRLGRVVGRAGRAPSRVPAHRGKARALFSPVEQGLGRAGPRPDGPPAGWGKSLGTGAISRAEASSDQLSTPHNKWTPL